MGEIIKFQYFHHRDHKINQNVLSKLNSLYNDLTAFSQSSSLTTNARFNSDDPWAIIITLTSSLAIDEKTLPAMPLMPRIPEPTTVTIDTSSKTFRCFITFPNNFNSSDVIALPKSSFRSTIEILDSEGP